MGDERDADLIGPTALGIEPVVQVGDVRRAAFRRVRCPDRAFSSTPKKEATPT